MAYTIQGCAIAALFMAVPVLAQDIPVKAHTLSNGMRVLLVERSGKPTIGTAWAARVGSVNETPGITGLAHFFEHLMFKGSWAIGSQDARKDAELNAQQDRLFTEIQKEMQVLRVKQRRGEIADAEDPKVRSPKLQMLLEEFNKGVKAQQDLLVKGEFDTLYTQAGAPGTNAFTSNDVTCYILTIPANALEFYCWMESDRLKSPAFREFYAERDVVSEERRLGENNPTDALDKAFNAMVWQAMPYHMDVIGYPADFNAITRDRATTFFKTYYAPNNLTLAMVGGFKAEEILPLLERYFGRIPASPVPAPEMVITEPLQTGEKRLVGEADAPSSATVLHKTVAIGHVDEAALEALATILNGRSGRLFQGLVLDQKVATEAYAQSNPMKFAGTFSLNGTVADGHTPLEVEHALEKEMEKVQEKGVTEQELQKAKNQIRTQRYAMLRNDMFLAVQLATMDTFAGYKTLLDKPAALDRVALGDVQRVAKKYFTSETRNIALYSRKGAAQ
jgi:predicted Zn-dependent peptidase